MVRVVMGLVTVKLEFTPPNSAVTVRDPGPICRVGIVPKGVACRSATGPRVATRLPLEAVSPTVPMTWLPTLNVTLDAEAGPLTWLGVSVTVNFTWSLYCAVLDPTVTTELVGALFTVCVKLGEVL